MRPKLGERIVGNACFQRVVFTPSSSQPLLKCAVTRLTPFVGQSPPLGRTFRQMFKPHMHAGWRLANKWLTSGTRLVWGESKAVVMVSHCHAPSAPTLLPGCAHQPPKMRNSDATHAQYGTGE